MNFDESTGAGQQTTAMLKNSAGWMNRAAAKVGALYTRDHRNL